VTLDCAGRQVHLSSSTRASGPNGEKVAIFANHKDGITIKNCQIVGQFDVGLWVLSSSNVYVDSISSNVGNQHTGLEFDGNSGVNAWNLNANAEVDCLSVSNDSAGSYNAFVDGCYTGIHVQNSFDSQILYSSVTGSVQGLVSNDNVNVAILSTTVENNQGGLTTTDDQIVIDDTVIRYNTNIGIGILRNTNSYFSFNVFTDNRPCDAFQRDSYGDHWEGNTLGQACDVIFELPPGL
jgi:hypothetical protein